MEEDAHFGSFFDEEYDFEDFDKFNGPIVPGVDEAAYFLNSVDPIFGDDDRDLEDYSAASTIADIDHPIFSHAGDDARSIRPSINDSECNDVVEEIISTLRKMVVYIHMRDCNEALKVVENISNTKMLYKKLPKHLLHVWLGIFEIITHECTVVPDGKFSFKNMFVARLYGAPVRDEINNINNIIDSFNYDEGTSFEPFSAWHALLEKLNRAESKESLLKLVELIDKGANRTDLLKAYGDIKPPTTQSNLSVSKRPTLSAKEFVKHHKISTANMPTMRYSSGLPSLDLAFTLKGGVVGMIAPGELFIVMGPTGTGKSSFSYGITPALTQDLVNYGFPDAKHVLFHTEEETIDKISNFRMGSEDTYSHLNEMMYVDAIGTSRQRMAHVLYDLVIEADIKAKETKRPISDFLPYIVQLDYLQAVNEEGDEKLASERTAEFLLRGVCAWDPDEMGKFSGVDFQQYAGMEWPEGMENHRVAVLAYAQLVKVAGGGYTGDEKTLLDFTVIDTSGNPSWQPQLGDLRVFHKNDMRGSGVVANNAHGIIILHRSRPDSNPVDPSKTEPNGREHLTDTRARILIEKSRNGTTKPYIELEFDRQVDGPKAQYFDPTAEKVLKAGRLTYDERYYNGEGTVILPLRDSADPLSQYRY